jgi:hypothetical protein
MVALQPRGIRNNNPGNIDYNSQTLWLGLDKPPSDGRFCRFVNPIYGIRVISKLLVAYEKYHGLNTIRGIIDRWAPPVENNTSAYVEAVSNEVGCDPDTVIDVYDAAIRCKIIKAIIRHENGQQPYDDKTIILGATEA